MCALKKALREDARSALRIIVSLPVSRVVEALIALLEGTLGEHFWLDPGAENQIRAELTNFVFLAGQREKITESFVFWRFLRITQDLLRDGLAVPRREIPAGILFQEEENPEKILSKLALECPDKDVIEISGQTPRRRGVRHKAAERALFLALRERHLSGQKEKCPDTNMSGQKVRQGMLFQFAA